MGWWILRNFNRKAKDCFLSDDTDAVLQCLVNTAKNNYTFEV